MSESDGSVSEDDWGRLRQLAEPPRVGGGHSVQVMSPWSAVPAWPPGRCKRSADRIPGPRTLRGSLLTLGAISARFPRWAIWPAAYAATLTAACGRLRIPDRLHDHANGGQHLRRVKVPSLVVRPST